MSLVLTAHGTRRSAGVAMIGDLAARVGELLDCPILVAFVDVLGPTPSEVLSNLPAGRNPAIVLPAFLSRGYHVRADLPAHIEASGHPNVIVTPALGPRPEIARLIYQNLVETGWQPDDSVILAAAGTSDRRARADLDHAARLLSRMTGSTVELGFAATGSPTIHNAVADARRRNARRVVVASYLLADGLFQERLDGCGADLVTRPLGTHPGLARLVAERFRDAAVTSGATIKGHQRATPTRHADTGAA